MEVPRITKITLNMGVGEAVADKKVIENAVADMDAIAGQKPVVTKARKSIAASRCATAADRLQGHAARERMYEFLDRLINVAMPRVRDFRGVSRAGFDGRGNYNLGVKEQIIFPEIDYDQIDALRGMDISITTTAKTTRKAGRCSRPSTSRSGTRGEPMAKKSMIEREKKRARSWSRSTPRSAPS
jgi:large subunit ribosomal protein L5